MERTKTRLIIGLFALIAIFSVSFVYAVAVSSPYHEGNPLTLNPGDTKTVTLELQNMVGESDITLRATIIEGSDIAKIIDSGTDYLVPAKTEGIKVNLRINIPKDAVLGSKKRVAISFATVTSGASEGAALGIGIEKAFDVLIAAPSPEAVQKKEQETSSRQQVIIAIVILIIIAAIILAILKRKRKAKR